MKLREAERYLKTKRYLLIVDYLNLMIPNRVFSGSKNDWQILGEISENLKQLARLKHIPIWTAAQLTKQGAKQKVLTAEDIGYAYKISQDADFGLGLIQTPEMEEEGTLKILCMKGREGKFGAITCYPDFQRMRINDKDAEDAE
jgi:replicative DNA helicase